VVHGVGWGWGGEEGRGVLSPSVSRVLSKHSFMALIPRADSGVLSYVLLPYVLPYVLYPTYSPTYSLTCSPTYVALELGCGMARRTLQSRHILIVGRILVEL
jgi:hypothetical protein